MPGRGVAWAARILAGVGGWYESVFGDCGLRRDWPGFAAGRRGVGGWGCRWWGWLVGRRGRRGGFWVGWGRRRLFCRWRSLVERASLVVEVAGGEVVPALAAAVFGAGKDLMVISVGALLDCPEIIDEAPG